MNLPGCLDSSKILINGVTFESTARPDLYLWHCSDQKLFWSATWLATILSRIGAQVDAQYLAYDISELGLKYDSALDFPESAKLMAGVVNFSERRKLIRLYEQQSICGEWRFALVQNTTADDFIDYLPHAFAAFEISMDSVVQGFVKR